MSTLRAKVRLRSWNLRADEQLKKWWAVQTSRLSWSSESDMDAAIRKVHLALVSLYTACNGCSHGEWV